ncbi:MAG: metallophosphoesterase [Bacteroidia bacterium]
MKILHITDLHFKTGKANDDQTHICRAIADGLTRESAPDLVFFTGDLVHSGNKKETFETAWKILTSSLIEKWGISPDRFFICPGNHDVDRGKELPMVARGVDEIFNLERLDDFTTSQNDKAEFDVSLKNLENYLAFQDNLKTTHFLSEDLITPLFTSHKRSINNKKVGIVSLNSAWRCKSSKIDRGNLMFPPSHLHIAFEHIQDCEVRLILMHHPISDFKEFISRELEKIIYRDFHVLFTGHIHGKRLDAHLLSEEGIAIVVGPAALVHYETWSNVGCGFYQIDTDLWKLNASVCEYDKNAGTLNSPRYYGAIEIPFNSVKAEKIALLEKLRQIYETEVEKANDLILPQPGETVKAKFLEVFTDPVIYDAPTNVISEKSKPFDFDLIRDEHKTKIIYGEDKSGKTLLLEKLFLDYLFMFTSRQVLPLLIDGKIYESAPSEVSIEQLLAN